MTSNNDSFWGDLEAKKKHKIRKKIEMNNRNKLNKSYYNEQNLLPTDQLFHAH